MTNQQFKKMVDWGCYLKALVREIHRGAFTGYEVIRAGRINGEDILDETRIYSTEILDRINRSLNQRAGRSQANRLIQFIDQE